MSVIPGSSCTNLVLLSEADIPSGNMDAGKSGAEMKICNHTKFSAKGNVQLVVLAKHNVFIYIRIYHVTTAFH